MKRSYSLRFKLILLFTLVLLGAVLLPSWYVRSNMQEAIKKETVTNAQEQLQLVKLILRRDTSLTDMQKMHKLLAEVGKTLSMRITYIADGGWVVSDTHVSNNDLNELDNHASRPEIIAARKGGFGFSIRYSGTLHKKLIYAATNMSSFADIPGGVLRISLPYSKVQARLDQLSSNIWGILGGSLILAVLIVFLLISQIGRSIQEMVGVATAIGAGDYKKRIHFYPGKEFAPLAKAVNDMAGNIGENISLISRQKLEQEAVFNGMKEGVLVLDNQGRIMSANKSMAELFPGLADKMGKRPLEAVLVPEIQEKCEQALANRENGIFDQISLQVEAFGGNYYDVSIVPVSSDVNLGAIVVFHDISEIKRVESIRKDFVANVSHELRTPLTSIKGYTETLLGLKQGEDRTSFLEIILKNANTMNKMLDDLLKLARIESPDNKFEMNDIDIYSSIYSAWKNCAPLADAKNVIFHNEIKANQFTVKGNSEQLVQVFTNLFENSIKYVPDQEGEIHVFATLDGNKTIFNVEDNGPGIPLEDQKRIFERFYRVEKHRNSSIAGTGLGLAICKHIIKNHNSQIAVTSPPANAEQGTVFSFSLYNV